jgi:aryl-alcohol dehydrogenase-like predicted oxidoreductase
VNTPLIPARPLRGIGRGISAVALGTSAFGSLKRAAPVYDRYAQRGGSFFDTAWVYGLSYAPGCCERTLGAWMTSRSVSNDMTVLVKGGHPPHCSPKALSRQLAESLERLRLNRGGFYMLHRDDTSIPVGEFIDVLRTFVDDGLVQAYGFSNWTIERVAAAIAYARGHNYPEPVALSNQLSLAVMHRPVYPGCVHAADAASRRWLEQTNFTLVPWSSQGRGVFTAVDSEADFRSGALGASWFSSGNWQRVKRARKMAADRGVLPVNIALAWVLQQPFPTFPIIGPRTVDELDSSLDAFTVRLSCEDLAWLNLDHSPEERHLWPHRTRGY